MATGFLDPIPLRARNCSNPNFILLFLHLFPIFSLQSSTQLSQTEFFKELHFFERNTKYIGLYSRIGGLTYILLLR